MCICTGDTLIQSNAKRQRTNREELVLQLVSIYRTSLFLEPSINHKIH